MQINDVAKYTAGRKALRAEVLNKGQALAEMGRRVAPDMSDLIAWS